MVNIVEDWDVLEEYSGEKLGFYELLENEGKSEVRVQTGRIGFRKEFEKKDDPLLARIVAFCRRRQYIRISSTVSDEFFFK